MKKYPKVRRPGHSSVEQLFASDTDPLVITEKMDGNNFRVTRDDNNELRFGSRNTVLGSDPDDIGGMFDAVSDYIAETVSPEDIARVEQMKALYLDNQDHDRISITLFGENAVEHTISEYEWEQVPQFQLFDVYVEYYKHDEIVHTEWLPWSLVEMVAAPLGLETVPVVKQITVGEFLENNDLSEYTVPESVYRSDGGPAEGVVFRNHNTGEKAKYISEEFAERHREAKQGTLKNEGLDHDHGSFMGAHVTDRRIEKNIAKLIEEPDSGYSGLEMEMMEDLHSVVWEDIWAEDYDLIIGENWTLDLDSLHNTVASRCASVLRELIQNNEQPVKSVRTDSGDVVGESIDA
jgi:hypothetical protein